MSRDDDLGRDDEMGNEKRGDSRRRGIKNRSSSKSGSTENSDVGMERIHVTKDRKQTDAKQITEGRLHFVNM